MGLFRRVLNAFKKPSSVQDPRDNEPIEVYDSYGRVMHVTRAVWRDEVLPGKIRDSWSNPDELDAIIRGSLHDGLAASVIDAARRFAEIAPDRSDGAVVHAVTLMEVGRLNEAKDVLTTSLQRDGEHGYVLNNLARIHAKMGDSQKAAVLLWRAIEVDPNQEHAVAWYAAEQRERQGEAAYKVALDRVAALPGSWYAQLLLASKAIGREDWKQALTLYEHVLAHAPMPVPDIVLMHITGELGKAGQLVALVRLAGSRFDPQRHSLAVGNNLINAYLELGELDDASRVLEAMHARHRPDWTEALGYWSSELSKARLAAVPAANAETLELRWATSVAPIWLPESSPAHEYFNPMPRADVELVFAGSTISHTDAQTELRPEPVDLAGRTSRALPLLLAEHAFFHTGAACRVLTPQVTYPTQSFGLFSSELDLEGLSASVSDLADRPSYFVATHLEATPAGYIVHARLAGAMSGQVLAAWSYPINLEDPQPACDQLRERLLTELQFHTDLVLVPPPAAYDTPSGSWFADYLLRLEQLLTMQLLASRSRESITNPREILQGMIHHCLSHPTSIVPRLVLLETAIRMQQALPAISSEFCGKITQLHTQHAPTGPVGKAVLARLQTYAARDPQAGID